MKKNRNTYVIFRCTEAEKAKLSSRATKCDTSTSDYCRTLSLGGRPKQRYSEEELQLLHDVAQLKGALQRLNNFFGGRQYREVFEENKKLIVELKKLLK